MSLVVMRHSLRMDLVGDHYVEGVVWEDRPIRPYDTPIICYQLPKDQGAKLKSYNIRRVICSPFRRCLQTAAVVCRELDLHNIIVDLRAGESMHEIRRANKNMFGADLSKQNLEYLCLKDSIETVRSLNPDVTIDEVIGVKPDYNEERTDSFERFKILGLEYLSKLNKKEMPGDILMISHGDAVNSIATRIGELPVKRVHECGFVVLQAAGGEVEGLKVNVIAYDRVECS